MNEMEVISKFIKITGVEADSRAATRVWYAGKITSIIHYERYTRINVEKSTISSMTHFDTDIWNIEILDIDEIQYRLLTSYDI